MEHNMVTEMQSMDDDQDTMGMSSRENEKSHSRSDPTQTSDDSEGELNVTSKLGMLINVVHDQSRSMHVMDTSKSKHVSNSRPLDKKLGVQSDIQRSVGNVEFCDSTNEIHSGKQQPSIPNDSENNDSKVLGGQDNVLNLDDILETNSVEVVVCYGMKIDEMNKMILQLDEFKSMILEKDNKIEQLKENLNNVENGFNGRLKAEDEKHAREILEKDKVIAMLRAEVEGDLVDETPVAKHKQVKRYPEPGSMAKRIKERSEGSRVKKKAKPLNLHELNDAIRKLEEKIKKEIKSAWEKFGEEGVFWKGLSPLAQVTVRDVLMILHYLQISNVVIDSWADILMAMYEELPSVERIIIFTSKCWDLITSVHDHKNRKFWDDKLDEVASNCLFIFPLLVTVNDGSLRGVRNHWMILILDIKKCQWSFYNLLRPRRGAAADNHLKGAFLVVQYVENKLSEVFKNKYPHHHFLRGLVKQPD
ncbi:hypothetical protein ACS0TY_021268 [Phlomoides rotata]